MDFTRAITELHNKLQRQQNAVKLTETMLDLTVAMEKEHYAKQTKQAQK